MAKPQAFLDKLDSQWIDKKFLCVGLDTDYDKLPESVTKGASKSEAMFNFNKAIIDATKDLVLGFKVQNAFYEAEGAEGYQALKKTADYLIETAPELVAILDAKRADIANTNMGYVKSAFDELGFDAITIHPYLGREAVMPFLERSEKGVFVLVRTSNPGASEFQDLIVDGEPLYKRVAKNVATEWNKNGNCGVVVGATYPGELQEVRDIVGEMPILIPGIGAQGGDASEAYALGKNERGAGVLIAAARSIIFASHGVDFADAARGAAEKITQSIS